MGSISDHHLQVSLPEILERVGRGEKSAIIKDGRAVACLATTDQHKPDVVSWAEVREAIRKMIEFQQRRGPTLHDDLTIREMIDEGRRS